MAQNLECEIVEGETQIPGMPNPWQVQMRWFERVMNSEGSFDRNLIRTWTIDAPSELVAKTIETAFTLMTDENYNYVCDESAVH